MPHLTTRLATSGHTASPAAPARPSRWAVWASREYQGLWLAQAVTLLGDQLARVALALLVYARTSAATASAAAYAITLLPALVGGPLLAGLADRQPRRTVMIRCDLACAALTAVMAAPRIPLPVLFGLVFMVSLLGAPFGAARAALVKDVFPGDDRYAAATAINGITLRAAQILGFTGGGLLVATVGARPALAIDAVTFAVSAVTVRAAVTARPAARADRERGHHAMADLRDGTRVVFTDPWLRLLTIYAWLAACHVVPVGLAVPVAAQHAGGPVTAGILLAAPATGTAAGMLALTRWERARQRGIRLIGPLAVLAAAPLIGCATNPPLPIIVILWAVAGAGTSYQLLTQVAFVSAVPDHRRGQAFGLVSAGMLAGQGAAMIVAEAVADTLSPSTVVATAGVLGTLAALTLLPWCRGLALSGSPTPTCGPSTPASSTGAP